MSTAAASIATEPRTDDEADNPNSSSSNNNNIGTAAESAATVETRSNAVVEVNDQWILVSLRRKKGTARAAALVSPRDSPINNNNNNNGKTAMHRARSSITAAIKMATNTDTDSPDNNTGNSDATVDSPDNNHIGTTDAKEAAAIEVAVNSEAGTDINNNNGTTDGEDAAAIEVTATLDAGTTEAEQHTANSDVVLKATTAASEVTAKSGVVLKAANLDAGTDINNNNGTTNGEDAAAIKVAATSMPGP